MRIAFIVSIFPKLSETFILNQITGLLDLGHDVEIFSEIPNRKEHKTHPDVEKYSLMERTRYFTTPDSKALRVLKGLALAPDGLRKGPQKMFESLNFRKYGKKALSLKLLYIITPFLGKRFDIIHCHFGINGALGIYLKDLGFGGKYVTSFHGYDVNSLPKVADDSYYSHLFEKGDYFTANTEFTRRQAIELGCPPEKIGILPVGVDIGKFSYAPRRLKPGEPLKILTIGRLVEKKGHEYAIRAFAKLIGKHTNIMYLIAGDGPLKEKLAALIRDLGLRKHVGFLNEVEIEEARNLYETSHIFLLPSVTALDEDREGQALVLQEAQATGMPVVSTYHNGIPEGVLDGRSGFLVPERDVDALAERMDHLIEHPDEWEKMGLEGRRFVESKYEIKSLNRQLQGIYQKLLEA